MGCRRPVFALVVLLLGSAAARADLIFVTSRDQIRPDGVVTWGALGRNFEDFSGPQYTVLPGIADTSLTVTGPVQIGGGFDRRDQGLGWNGSFNAGEQLIWSRVDGSFRIDFWNTQTGAPAPIAGFGARYQDSIGDGLPTSGRLRGFDALDNPLFSFEFSAPSYYFDPPGSASYIGALGSERNIAYLYYDDLRTGAPLGQQGFALGTLYVQADASPPSANPVPAPPGVVLVGVALLCGGVASRFRRRHAEPGAAADGGGLTGF